MIDHDEMCPYSKPCPEEWRNTRTILAEGLPTPHRIVSGSSGRCVECDAGDCQCDLIARVREAAHLDGYRDAMSNALELQSAIDRGWSMALSEVRAGIKRMRPKDRHKIVRWLVDEEAVLRLLDDLGERR